MDEKLQQIIATMVANGESHDTITAVIERYKAENTGGDVVEKTQVVAEETVPVAAETPAVGDTELVSKDISLDGPIDKPQASIMVGGNRVYLSEVIQSLQDQDNRPLEVQTKEYKDKVIDITKNPNLSKEQKNEQISSVLKPSYLILESGTGDEAVYAPRPEVKKKMADNMPESIKEFETKEDLTSAINESIGKTIRDDEGIKALVEIQQFNKKDILEEKALEIQNKADLTTPEGVAKAKKEFNDFYAAEVYGEVQKSPAFNKIIKDLEVVGADVAGDLNKEWGRYNDDFLKYVDESSFLRPGGVVESGYKGLISFGSYIDKTMLSGEQLAFQKSDEELKDLESKIENKSIKLDDEISIRKQEIGASGKPTFTVENVKVKDRLEELKSKKENLTENIVEGLDKIKATDDYLALFTESPDIEGFGFEYALNAAKAAPSIIAEQAPQLIVGGLSVFGGPITAGIATAAMFTPMYAENYWGALTDGLRDDLGREPEQKDYIKALEEGKYASQANSAAFAAVQTAAERFGAKKVLSSTFGKIGKNTMNGVGSLYKGEIKKFGKNALAKGLDMTEGAFTERLTESAQSFLNQVSVGTQTGGATDMFKYIDLDQINKEGEMGMIAGFFMPFGTNVARQSFVELRNSARDVATKFDLTSNIELAQADRFFKAAQENIDNKFKNGEITAEEKQIEVESLANTRNAGLKIPKKFGTQAKQKSFDLILERQKLQDNVNKQDEAFTGPDKQRIKEINTELGNIQSVETATRSAVKAVEKADIDINVIELDTEVDVENYLKENTNMAASKAKEAGKQRGFILEDGKTIVINKDVASKEGAVTTAAHEILHGVLFNTLNKGDESAFALANAIKMQLSNISTEDFKNSDLAARIEQYKADPDINEATKAEEVLTLFSEAIATGDIKFEEGVFTKLKDFVRRILQNAGFSNIDFNDSKDVYNFIKDYNKSVSKGKFTKAQVKAAKEGVVVSERLKDRVKDVAEKGVDETILKFSKVEENKEIKEIFDEFTGPAENRKFKSKKEFKDSPEYFKALEEIEQSNTLDASIRNVVGKSYLDINPGFVKEVKEKISDKFKSEYDASKNSLFGWLTGKNISGQPLINRAAGDIQIKRGKKPSTVSADKKIGGEESRVTIGETLVSDEISPEDYTDMMLAQDKLKKIKPQQSKIAKKIDLTKNELNLVKRDITNFLRKSDRPAMTDPKKFFKAFVDYVSTATGNRLYDKLSASKDGLLSTKNRKAFIESIAEDLIALNKVDSSVMRRSNWTPFYELEIKRMNPTQTQKAIDEGRIPSTVNLKAGNDLFKTLDPSVDQVVDYLMGIRPDVLKRKMPKFLAEVIAKNEFNDIVNNPNQPVYDTKGDLTDRTIDLSENITEEEIVRGAPQVIEKIARPKGIKFSLSTESIQEELNELALLRDKNKIAKKLNFKADAIKESNRGGLIKMMLKAAKEGFMDKAVIIAGAMTSAGRQTFYGDKNNRFNGYTQAKKAGIKNIGKYFKTKDGNFYRFADAKVVDGVLQTFNLDKYRDQIIEVDPSLWVAKPGNLFWGKDDPAYKELLKEANDSPFDENGYKQIGISAKGDFIGKKALIKKLDKKVGNTEMTQSEINMKMLDHVVTQLAKAVENGMSMDIAGMIIIQSYQATGGLIKAAAPFEGISDVFEAGEKLEKRSQKLYREEHNPPASVVGANLLWAIKNNAAKEMMKEVRKNFSQTILSKKDDSKLDIDYAATMPVGTNMSSNPIIRMAMAGINLNTVRDLRTGQTYADKFGLGVDNKFKNIDNVAAQQNKLIEQVVLEGLNIKEAKKQLDQYLKIAPSQLKASKSTNTTLKNSKVLDVEGNLNIEDLLSKAAGIDEALSIARDINAPVKKIRVFDFDDTLAITKSNVLFTAPDGTEGSLTAEKFAMDGARLLEEGYVFDFSEFNKVTKGKPGPLLDIAKKIQAARGTEDVFVLTARAPEAQVAIKEFLDSVGLDIPLKNITGLGNSTGEAKANWMVNKAAEGYNDFYFADDALQNVEAVRKSMNMIDVKSKAQLVRKNEIKFSKTSSKKLNFKTDEAGNIKAGFTINNKKYNINLDSRDNKGSFDVEFNLDGRIDITGTGDAVKVVRTVYNGLLDAIDQNDKIKKIEFSSLKSEPSRVRLYTTLMNSIAKKLGWNTDVWESNNFISPEKSSYDFEITKPRKKQVAPVEKVLNVVDVKSKTQQAKFSLAEDLNSDFNKILENKTGIGSEKVYSDARAKTVGASKGKFKFFIPPSAEDFVGLLYPTLAKGKLGDEQMAWYKERLLNPFARAMENLSRDRVNLMNDFKALKKELEVPKDLRKEAIDGFTNEQAVRVYLWNKQGLDIPGISKRDLKDLTEVIDKNPKLKVFADQLQAINKSEGYPAPQDSWLVGTITTDLINGLNTVKRAKYLEEWQTNADIIFSKENLNKMEAIYGPKYREAMENILSRMKTGKNRLFSESRIGNQVLDYINGSIGAIMFFNTRSAVLQTISSINFINWSDNNIYKAGKAFANQPQYWKDFTTLMNSDFLKDRRQGLKLNISESEIADAAKTSKNKAKAALNYILQKGFLPTQIADSFAIASGGATFYRNKINSLVKEGMSEKEAEAIAYREFREIAEESQQSSRPDKISQQQASNVGRVILAFANTPSQYARIIKKAVVDLKNKRGNWKNNVSKIMYYGAMQNLIFNVLQQALFAVGFGDDEEESKEREKKYISIGNGMVDSLLRGLGYGGAAVSVAKNLLLDVYERSKRDRPEYVDAAWKLLDFSPPIDSKVSKLKAAGYMVDKYEDDMISKGFAIDNPAYEAASKVVSATTNVPLDRVFTKANNISAAMGEDAEVWQRVAMMMGWPEWQIKPKQKKKTFTLIE